MIKRTNVRVTKLQKVSAAAVAIAALTCANPLHADTKPLTVRTSTIAAGEIPSLTSPKGAGDLVSVDAIANLDALLLSVAGRADRVTYRSQSLSGDHIVVSGALFTPKGEPPQRGWPIVSWGHGSSGTNDQCAPSTVRNKFGEIDLYGYSGFIVELLKAGYAVVATDYEGLGTVGEHPYIIADSEGRSMIDAVRAAQKAEASISKSWFSVGHSQGGQAAIAAGELATSWGRGMDFRGTIGLAPVTNVGQAYSYGSPDPVNRGFYLLALQGLKTVHADIRYEDYLGKQALAMLPATEKDCTLKIWEDFSANLGDKLNDYQFTPQTTEAALALQPLLDAQSVPRGKTPGPMLLLQGDQDPSIKIAVTKQAVLNALAAGTSAEFRLYPGMDHYSVLAGGKKGGASTDVINWLNQHKPQ